MAKKKLIIIAGATASGKTNLAIQIAQHFNTKIISADSRQCYKELNIGVAKPTKEQLLQVEHFFINSHSITQNINAGVYEKLALQYLENIFSDNDNAIMVGGTGLYIKALCDGIDLMPEINEDIKIQVNDSYKVKGTAWLQEEIKKHDSLFFEKGEIQNPARMLRALSFVLSTGESILNFQNDIKVKRDFEIQKYCIDIDRDFLYKNINNRVDKMMADGLLDEVQSLIPNKHLKNLQTVGYTELFSYLNHEIDLPTAINLIKQNTRHYAKRQTTWFKKQEFIWMNKEEMLRRLCK